MAEGAYKNYEQSQGGGQSNFGNNQSGGDFGVTGGAQFNQPASQNSYDNQSNGPDLQAAAQHATDSAGDSGDSNMFSQATSFISNQNHQTPVDEQAVQDAHSQAYGQGNASSLDASSMGSAAALQALKSFTSGGGSGSQSALIGAAMSEAAKLFASSGGAASGTQQDAVNSAGATVMKLLMQGQMSNMIGGGNSGGLGSLMGMASKFM